MKQGRASHSNVSATKREPISHRVDPGAVDKMGNTGKSVTSRQLYVGKGVQAPKHSVTIHPRGSQRG